MTNASVLAGILVVASLIGCSGSAPTATAPTSDDAGLPTPGPAPSDDAGVEAGPPADSCVYPPVERATFTSRADGATTTFLHLHPNPVGVIIALHGAGGSSSGLAELQNEWASFFHVAVGRGYTLVIPESAQREAPRQWNVQSLEPEGDVARIDAIVADLVAKSAFAATTPIYVIGMSNGGGAAPVVGAGLASKGRPVRAVGVYCAGGSSIYERVQYTLPTTFNLMAEDGVVTNQAGIEANAKLLEERGVDAQIFVKPASVACPGRFTRIPGISEADSRAIYDGLVAGGTLAADGRVIAHERGEEVQGLPAAYKAFQRVIDEQLRVVMADHVFYGDRNEATLAFFDGHR